MRCAHISRFSVVIRPIRVRTSTALGRRPGRPVVRRERRRQYVRQPCRCQRSTVSGFTTRREVCQPLNQRHAKIQKRRPQGADAACGAAGPPAVGGGKDCLRSAAPLVGQPQQAPTENSETLTCTSCCWTVRRLKLFNAVNGNGPCGSQFCALRRNIPFVLYLSILAGPAAKPCTRLSQRLPKCS